MQTGANRKGLYENRNKSLRRLCKCLHAPHPDALASFRIWKFQLPNCHLMQVAKFEDSEIRIEKMMVR